MDVGDWLRSLGLEQYEAAFRDNDIDEAVLPGLTVDDLKDLGVAPVGHRRKIMSAINGLKTLREHFADIVEAEPELLAHHFTEAGLARTAIEYWGRAGKLALYRSAFKEAIAHLGKAIEMTEELAGAGEVDQTGRRLNLHVAYAHAMIAAHGHGAPEIVAAFVRAHDSPQIPQTCRHAFRPTTGYGREVTYMVTCRRCSSPRRRFCAT